MLSSFFNEELELTGNNAGLHLISVDPVAQGTGVGKRLLRSVTEKAAEEGLPVTLEAMEGEEEGLVKHPRK